MDGFCNQNADLLGSLAGLSFPVVYVGVVECAPASPYTYSSTHRFPDERTPIEATPLSATSAELGLAISPELPLLGLISATRLVQLALHALQLFWRIPSRHMATIAAKLLQKSSLRQLLVPTSGCTHRMPAGFGSGFGIGFTLLTRSFTRHSSSRHPPFTQYPFPSRSLVRDGHTSPHMPRLVVPHSTCPSQS